ncbi:MAG: T9SS type A sorting domain-containing protein [Ignavibacteriaceae bacterium]|nr:T9SS type A sorting domain-containing protein [Ignavibacteriaceae bacterium]
MRRQLVLLFILLISIPVITGDPGTEAQVIRTGNVQTFLDSLVNSIPADTGTNIYSAPSSSDTAQWSGIISDINNGDYSSAHSRAGLIGYGVTQFTDEGSAKIYYILAKTGASSNYWGIYAFNNAADRRKLLIQAPHPVYDFKTGLQSVYVFLQTGARALFVNGVHRCNSTDRSECAGTTTVCSTVGASDKFRKSDAAHNVDGMFHKTLLVLEPLIVNTISVQLHGFSWVTGDPDLLMSNGTTNTPSPDYLSALKDELILLDDTLTFGIHHISALSKLSGTTNIQGRYINESSNPCSTSASSPTGRFLHIEQAYKNLRDNQTNWNKMVTALKNTFDEDPLPVELTDFSVKAIGGSIRLRWVTATEVNNFGFEIEKYEQGEGAGVFAMAGFLPGSGNSHSPKEYSFTDTKVTPGRAYYYRLKQIDTDGSFNYSKVVSTSVELSGFDVLLPYPNPFSGEARIGILSGEESEAVVQIVSAMGERAAETVKVKLRKGYNEYPVSAQVLNLSPGIYFIRVSSGKYVKTRKLIHLK